MAPALDSAIRDKTAVVGVGGLGYVGLPLIRAFVAAGFFLERPGAQTRARPRETSPSWGNHFESGPHQAGRIVGSIWPRGVPVTRDTQNGVVSGGAQPHGHRP